MSMLYCFDCDTNIDTDRDVEHFTDIHVGGDIPPYKRPSVNTGYLCDYEAPDGLLCGLNATTAWPLNFLSPDGHPSDNELFRCDGHPYHGISPRPSRELPIIEERVRDTD